MSLLVAVAISGCATFKNVTPFPAQAGTTSVAVASEDKVGMNDRPVGGLYDEKSRLFVTGHQKGMVAGLLFGVVGVLAADSINKSSAKSKFGEGLASLAFDQVAEARTVIGEQLASGKYGAFAVAGTNARVLEVEPRALLVVNKEGLARLYALWKVRLLDAKKTVLWESRYFASAKTLHPAQGDGNWFTGDHYAAGLREAMGRAAWALFNDVSGQLPEGRTVKVKGPMAWLNDGIFELPAVVLAEQPDATVVRILVGDAFLASGTHVFHPGEVAVVDAKIKDPRK